MTRRTPRCLKTRYNVTDAPQIACGEGSHAPGITLRPTEVEISYTAPYNGHPARVDALVDGCWTLNGTLLKGEDVTEYYRNGADWPDWVTQEAREMNPDPTIWEI
jgi:hypothetical protein